jgi:DNA polymerase-3 subunit gamma/tau
MRDALSLLDQVIAFSPKRLVGDEVSRVLGVAGYSALVEIGEAVLTGQPARVLESLAALANQSCELTVVARDLLGLFRDLVVAKLCSNTDELLDLSDEERQRVRQLAGGADANDLMRLQQGFAKGFDDVSRSAEPRVALEMLLVRLALRPELLPLDGLMARLAELEGRLSSGKPPPASGANRPGPSGGAPRSGAPRPAPSHSASSPVHAEAPSPERAFSAERATPESTSAANPQNAANPERASSPSERTPPLQPSPGTAPARPSPAPAASASVPGADVPSPANISHENSTARPSPAPAASASVPGADVPSRANPSPGSPASTETSGALPGRFVPSTGNGSPGKPVGLAMNARAAGFEAAGMTAAPAPPAPPTPPPARPVQARAKPGTEASAAPVMDPEATHRFDQWRRVLECLGQERSDLVAFLKHTVPLRVDAAALTLGYELGNVLEVPMRSEECLKALRAACASCFGQEPKIVFEPVTGSHQTLAEADKRVREQQKRAAVDRAQQHPSVLDAAEILGARVKRIEVGEG